MDLDREDEGIETLRQLIEKYPNSRYAPHSIYSIADYYYNEQDYQTALTYYQQVMNDYPDSEVAEKVPGTLEDLKETIAYLDYEKAFNVFDSAKKDNDLDLYRQAAEMFIKVAEDFPFTESEIGAYSNAGICYEALDEWRKAVECYDIVIERYDEGEEVSMEAFNFAKHHKQYIEANKF